MISESKKTILLVEDMAIIAMAEANTLKKNGYNVIIAGNGNEAIKLASENSNLDLILMDIDLGKGMDGTEAAQIILKNQDIPIVFLSNHTEKEIVDKTEKITSYGYVVKNSGETVLLASIKMAFKLFEAHHKMFESEMKLLDTDRKFHTLEKQIDDVIWTMDMNFRFTYVSPSIEKMHGYTVDEMMKLTLQDFLTEESSQKVINILAGEISSYLTNKREENSVTFELEQMKKDGSVFLTEIRARFLLDNENNPVGIIGVTRDITQRLLSEKAIRESEKTLNLALEGAQIGLWDQNFKTGIVKRNDHWAKMLGYDPEEITNNLDFWKSNIHPDDLEIALNEAKKHEQGLIEFYKVQHRIKCKNGNYKWILNWGKISERDKDGNPVRAVGIHLDVDENIKTEESLKLSEERLRYALEGNSDGIWDWNLKTGEVFFSPRYYTMLGYQPNEFKPSYEKWKDLMYKEDFEKSETEVLNAIKKLSSFSTEFRLRKKDGSYSWILSRGKVAEKDSDGKALRISGSHTDINERKLAEEVLKKNENKLNSIFKAAPVGIGMTSNRVLLEVNDTMCKMLGYNCDELIGNSALMLYPTVEEFELVGREKYKQIEQFGTGTVETKWVCKNGKIIDVLLSSTPLNLRDVSGGVTFTALDITERKKTEIALKESQQMLQNVLDKFPGVVFWKDVNSIYLGCNLTFAIGAGLKNADEIIGKTDFDLPWAKTEAKKYQADDKQVMNSGVAKLNIIETQHQSGNKIAWFDTNKIPLIDDLGKLYGVLGTSTDITNRKEAEEALRISEERYSLAQKAANIGSWDWNMLTDELSWSELVIPMFGFKPGEFKGTIADFWNRLHPDDIPMIEEKIKATIEKNENYRVEHRVIHPDGNIRWMLEAGNVFNDKDGKPYRMLGMVQDITERKTAEELLRNSEANLNSLVNNRNEAIWSIDNNYNFIFVNNFFKQEFLNAFNIELKRGMNALSILTPEQIAFWKPKYDAVLSGEHLTFRFSNQLNNELKFYEATLSPIISDGKVIGVSALSQDITDRENIEQSIKESERKLSESLKVAKVGYWEYDVLSDKFIFNDQYYSLHKTTAKEVGGYEMSSKFFAENFVYPEDSATVGNAIFQAIESTDERFEYKSEARIMTIDKKPIWVIVWFRVTKDLNGKTIRLMGVNQDINSRKLAEDRLKQSEEKYRRFFEEDLSGVFLSTPESGLKTCNQAYVNMLEYDSIEELLKSNPVSHYSQSQKRIDFLNLIRKEKKLTNYEGEIVTKFGKHIQTLENIIGVFDDNDNLIEFWGYVNDITDRKKAEQILKNAAMEKEALHRELLHRVKNSFNLIKSLMYLEGEKLNNKEAKKILENLEMRIGTLSKMYSLLNLSGISQKIDLGEYLNQITNSLAESYLEDATRIEIKSSFEKIETSPRIASSVGLIVNEILTNSLKYAFPDSKKGNISISLKAIKENVEIEISDNGVGVSDSFSLDDATGMGLQLINMLTQQLSGTVSVEANHGTKFKVVFPLDQ